MTAKDGDKNMIRREVFQELRILDNLIQNATAHFEGDAFTYHDVCARWENECFYNDILNLDYIMDEVSEICSGIHLAFPHEVPIELDLYI